jgi:hypothetical protein
MATEVWFRDPYNYVRELIECGQGLIAWNRGVLIKRSIDPVSWAQLYYGESMPVRQLCIGSQGTAEVGPGRGLDHPIAVYPTWTYGDPLVYLEDMLARPVGQDMHACTDLNLARDERPVFGQEHRVVVTGLPNLSSGLGRNLITILKHLQEDHPEANLMLHGTYSFKMCFGLGFRSADVEPRTGAASGTLLLANGAEANYKRVQKEPTWLKAVGMTPGDLDVPRNRCIFNIRSAVWSAANLAKVKNFRSTRHENVDTKTPDVNYVMPEGRNIIPAKLGRVGTKVVCNACTLQLSCKQFRRDEVCSLTDSDTGKLARLFGTRDSRGIVDGLQALAMLQANRLETAVSIEEELGDISPEVSKLINSLFSQGVTLAKLLDPTLRGGGVKVQVGVVNGQATAAVSTSTPAELTGNVVRALEAQGIPRDKITPQMVMATIEGMGNPENVQRAVEGTVISEGE